MTARKWWMVCLYSIWTCSRALERYSPLLSKASYSIAALDVAGISKFDRKFYLKRSIQIERDKAQRRSNNLININRFVHATSIRLLEWNESVVCVTNERFEVFSFHFVCFAQKSSDAFHFRLKYSVQLSLSTPLPWSEEQSPIYFLLRYRGTANGIDEAFPNSETEFEFMSHSIKAIVWYLRCVLFEGDSMGIGIRDYNDSMLINLMDAFMSLAP